MTQHANVTRQEGITLDHPAPCPSSWWVGKNRDELHAAMLERLAAMSHSKEAQTIKGITLG